MHIRFYLVINIPLCTIISTSLFINYYFFYHTIFYLKDKYNKYIYFVLDDMILYKIAYNII